MPSEYMTGQYLEWCIDVPSKSGSRESLAFSLKGNEWIFRSDVEFSNRYHDWYFSVFLDLKKKHRDLEPYSVKCEMGFKILGNTSSWRITELFELSHHYRVFYISLDYLKKNLPPDYKDRNSVKLVFFFEGVTEPLLNLSEETESQMCTIVAFNAPKKDSKSSNSRMNVHLEALSRDFSKLLDESSSFDVEITCEGKTFKSHRNVLETRSTVFAAMLKSDMVEGKTGLIKVEDISAFIFESFLRYLYSGTFPEFSIDTAKQFYEASDKYAVEELKIACSEFLIRNLSVDNACEVLVLADQHSDENFRNDVIAYIVEKKIPRRFKQWSYFCKMHPILAIEVQNLYIQKHCPE